jgi:hypothetical protein
MDKNINNLPQIEADSFNPSDDYLIVQKKYASPNFEQGEIARISFNNAIKTASFNYQGPRFFWQTLSPAYELKYSSINSANRQKPLTSLLIKKMQLDTNYHYFDCKVADITQGTKKIIPDYAKHILIGMKHKSLEVLDVGVHDDNGWRKFESNRGNFVFENMQYPRVKIFPTSEDDYLARVPSYRDHPAMTPLNHMSFRCPVANKADQKLWILAWSE